jgi:hypothetical protein
MAELTTEQMLYLLYAKAYAGSNTVTKGIVKSCLPKIWKENAEHIYQFLHQHCLIQSTSKGRFLVTNSGEKNLAKSLAKTNYKFDSAKGCKILNTLLEYIISTNQDRIHPNSSNGMTFDEFQDKFKALYLEERAHQEIRGVVAIQRKELCQIFIDRNALLQKELDLYFDLLKSTGKIFSVIEKDNEIIQWVE